MEGNGYKELTAWLTRNQEKFANYTTDDIQNLAIACGFNRIAVAQWVSSTKFKGAI